MTTGTTRATRWLGLTLAAGALGACAEPSGSGGVGADTADGGVAIDGLGPIDTIDTIDAIGAIGAIDTYGSTSSADPSDAADGVEPADAAPRDETDVETTPSAPIILSLATDVERITMHERFTITAVVTDPDGIDDLIGGTLLDADGERSFGAFATAASEGAYQISLGWDELDTAASIAFDAREQRELHAVFYDQLGHATTGVVAIGLWCEGAPACDGTCGFDRCAAGCVSWRSYDTNDDHCGGCDNACDGGRTCVDGACVCPDGAAVCDERCVDLARDGDHCGGCGQACDSGRCGDGHCACGAGVGVCGPGETCLDDHLGAAYAHCHALGPTRHVDVTTFGGHLEVAVDGVAHEVCNALEAVGQVACRELYDVTGVETDAGPSHGLPGLDVTCAGGETRLRDCTIVQRGSACTKSLDLSCSEQW